MSKLRAALAWAARGFPVFPLLPDSKEPAFGGSWHEHATTDIATIRSMWTDPVLGTEQDYNIGMDCTDRVVVDIDEKWYTDAKTGEKRKKDGYNQYMQLGGSFDTLVVKTPSGGYHCYFEGPDSANVNIARDIEIRSHHGYVVAPGSTIDGVPYEVITDIEPAWIPLNVEKLLKAPEVRRDMPEGFELDSAANIQAGINYLQSTPVAIEGQRGDETTFITAARLVRELGLSPFTAFELMRDHWNERCIPPWQLDELQGKVENAASYGTADVGRLDPSILFATVNVEPPPSPFTAVAAFGFGNAAIPSAIRPRPWLVDRVLMTEKVTAIGAVGSGGKSSAGLALAAHLALGRDFGKHKVHKKCKTIVYNGEDDVEEQSRRLLAVCVEYGFDYQEVSRSVMLLSYEDVNMKLVKVDGRSAVPNDAVVNGLIELAKAEDIGCIILDPLVDVHSCDEGDSTQMNVVMQIIQHIAKTAGVAVLVMHHTTKAGSEKQENRIGNMDIFRGSSAIVYKSRVAFTLMDASAQDAQDYGMQDSERHAWVRMDDAKMNLSLRDATPMWFRKVGVRIQSGDFVGVLKHEELTKSVNHLRLRLAELLINTMMVNNTATMPMMQAVGVIRAGEPLMANNKDLEIRQKLESSFALPIMVREKTLQVVREQGDNGKGDKVYVRMS